MGKLLKVVGVVIGLGTLALLSSSEANAQAKGEKKQQIPASLVEVGEFGENIYDLAKAKDWAKTAEKLKALKEAAKKLATDLKDGAAEMKRLDSTIVALDKAVAAKDRLVTMGEANQVTLIAANLVAPFNPPVPAAVTRLDHYGRELEIGVEAKDKDKLKTTADALIKTWEKLQPAVKARGGDKEAKKFSELMVQVGAAKSVEDYGKVVTPILDEVDNLEKVFLAKKTALGSQGQGPPQWVVAVAVTGDEVALIDGGS